MYEHHLHASHPVNYDVISADVKAAVESPACAHESFHDSWSFSSCRDRLFRISSEKRPRPAIIAVITIIIQGIAWKSNHLVPFSFFFPCLIEECRGKLGEGAGFGGAGDKKLWDGNGVNLLSPWNTSFSRLELWQPGNYIRSSIPHIRLFPTITFHVSFAKTVMQKQKTQSRAEQQCTRTHTHTHSWQYCYQNSIASKTEANGSLTYLLCNNVEKIAA